MRPALILLALGLLALPAAADAVQTPDVPRLQAEFRDERTRALRLRAEARDAAAAIAELERRLTALRTTVGDDDAVISGQRARLEALGGRETALVAQLSLARGREMRLLSALQMMSRRPPPPLLVPADKAVDTVRAAILIKAMEPELRARARALADRQGEIARLRRLAALGSEALFTRESARGDRRGEIEALMTRKRALQAVLGAEASESERAARVLEARLAALGARAPEVDPDADATSAALPAGRSRLTPPVAGTPSERFGAGSSGWRWLSDGSPARAPAAGRVIWTGPLSGWGQVVILDLGPGWRAVVAGLDTVAVQAGTRVGDGQALGGSAAGGDVYFELRRDDRPVDPAPWLR